MAGSAPNLNFSKKGQKWPKMVQKNALLALKNEKYENFINNT